MEQTSEELQSLAYQASMAEAFESINKGIRPPKMSMELFRFYRKLINKSVKNRLKGEMFHVSKTYGDKSRGITYYKPK